MWRYIPNSKKKEKKKKKERATRFSQQCYIYHKSRKKKIPSKPLRVE